MSYLLKGSWAVLANTDVNQCLWAVCGQGMLMALQEVSTLSLKS